MIFVSTPNRSLYDKKEGLIYAVEASCMKHERTKYPESLWADHPSRNQLFYCFYRIGWTVQEQEI